MRCAYKIRLDYVSPPPWITGSEKRLVGDPRVRHDRVEAAELLDCPADCLLDGIEIPNVHLNTQSSDPVAGESVRRHGEFIIDERS